MTWLFRFSSLLLLGAAAASGCAVDPEAAGITGQGGADGGMGAGGSAAVGGPPVAPVGPPMTGLHVVGNHIENADGATVALHGVNRSGTEYKCAQNGGIFDGPFTVASIQAITTWKANAVRVPLNEACWLGINGVMPAYGGDNYKRAIRDYVTTLHQFHIVPILDLHWVGPGTAPADRQQPMPDADHAPAFWTDVAVTFLDDDGVVFEPYNEPFPDSNRISPAAWQCWRDGCMANQAIPTGGTPGTYLAAGLQALVSAIRATGSRNLILLGGVQYSNDLSQWLAYKPTDPLGNLGAAWHVYNFNACVTATCWDGAPANVAAMVPLVATEIGERDCLGTFITPLMQWLDGHGGNYLAWSWDAYGACMPYVSNAQRGRPWSLIADYTSGAPNGGYAQAFRDHLLAF